MADRLSLYKSIVLVFITEQNWRNRPSVLCAKYGVSANGFSMSSFCLSGQQES
jgi:hypothetical protein